MAKYTGRSEAKVVKGEQRRLLWQTYGAVVAPNAADWDPKSEQLVEALLAVLGSGCAVMFGTAREGSAISVQVYEGDYKYPRVWISEAEELDTWAEGILRRKGEVAAAAD